MAKIHRSDAPLPQAPSVQVKASYTVTDLPKVSPQEPAAFYDQDNDEDYRRRETAKCKKKRGNLLYTLAMIVFAAIFFISGGLLVKRFLDDRKTESEFADLQSMIDTAATPAPAGENVNPNGARFAALRDKNSDFIGWISIDGTNLERNLYLTTQLVELGIPVVVAINMMDIVRKNGDQIRIDQLAKELGCNKIALGHHFDDVIETILMSMIYGGQVETMMPKLHSANFEGMQLIRPMYLIREADIKHWCRYHDLQFIQCACHFTDTCTTCDPDERTVSKRMVVKQLIAKLAEENPQIEKNIFRSVENINLNKIISYQKDHVVHSFLDDYRNE